MIRERRLGGTIILALEPATLGPPIKGACEAELKERIDRLVREGQMEILVDLKACHQLDSAELGRLIRCHISVRRAGGRVRIFNLSPRMAMVMKTMRLDTVLDLFETEEEALASLGSAPGAASS